MKHFINHIKENSKANSISEEKENFSLSDQKTILNLVNNEKVLAIKIDKFYKPLIDQQKCDFIIYKTNKAATFIELKGDKYNLEQSKAFDQLSNTIIHFKEKLIQEEIFAIIAARGFARKIKDNKKTRNFIKKTNSRIFEINVLQEKYNLDSNQVEKLKN